MAGQTTGTRRGTRSAERSSGPTPTPFTAANDSFPVIELPISLTPVGGDTMRMIRALRGLLLAGMVGTAFLSIGIEPALAQRFEPSCKTFTHRYFLSAGSAIPLRVGFVDTSLTICRRSDGFIESADAGQTTGTTGPGTAAGFVVEPSLAVVTEQKGATVKSKYEGRVRVCLAQRTPICSESHDYTIFAHFSPVGPTTRDRTEPEWSHAEETPGGVHYHEDS